MLGIGAQFNGVLSSRSQKLKINGLARLGSHIEFRVPSKLIQVAGRI